MTALSPTVRLDPSVLQSVPSSIIPSADNTYDLGSSTNRWRDLWISNLIRLPNNNIIGVYISPSEFPWSIRRDAIIIGRAGLGTTLVLNDFDGAKWAIGIGNWDFAVAKQVVTSTGITWSTAFYIDGGGSASSPPKRLVTMVPILPMLDNTYDLGSSTNRWRDLWISNLIRLPNNNIIGVYISPSEFPWSIRRDAIIIGRAGLGTTLVLNDFDGAKWAIGIGNWDFAVAKQVVTSTGITWSTAFYIDGGGSASSPPKRLVTMVPIIPSTDNTYDLGSSTNRWRSLYLYDSIYFGYAEMLKRGIYAYKIKHNETVHPTEIHDLLYRFVFKYLNNIQTSAIINNLSHSFDDEQYTGIYAALIYISQDGYYDIGVNSDDASAVWIDGILAVAWLGEHGIFSNWYVSAFNSISSGACYVKYDRVPCLRTVLHPNGIRLNKGWHLIVAIFEEVRGADQITVYIRPHQPENPGSGTSTGWRVVGDDAVSAGYIADYRAVPLGLALWSLETIWNNSLIYNAERNYVAMFSHIIPSADNTYDLGSPANRWRTVYVAKAVTGDVVFANGWRITEDGDALLFINPNGKPALKLKPDGTLERLK